MVTISGYAAIYFEAMLKRAGERVTIWERNFQLAFYSIFFMIIMLCVEHSNVVSLYILSESNNSNTNDIVLYKPPFEGWTVNAVIITLISAIGGLLVAATLKYADAVLKTLATSGSIVLSALVGWMLLGGTLDIFVGIGCVATILAIFNYTFE